MTRTKAIIATASIALTLGATIAFAQRDFTYPRRADPELVAAMQSMQDAMTHLQKARAPNSLFITRARAYIALAATELQTEPGEVFPGEVQ
jgi:hypothetical protein